MRAARPEGRAVKVVAPALVAIVLLVGSGACGDGPAERVDAPAARSEVTAPAPPPAADPEPSSSPASRGVYSTPVVLFVEPDSAEIDQLQRRLGEDFFVVADDAMWYRAAAYEFLDSLNIPHAEVERGSARFLVEGRPTVVGWEDVDRTWFLVVYDGRSAPAIASDVDIRDAVAAFPVAPDRGGV